MRAHQVVWQNIDRMPVTTYSYEHRLGTGLGQVASRSNTVAD